MTKYMIVVKEFDMVNNVLEFILDSSIRLIDINTLSEKLDTLRKLVPLVNVKGMYLLLKRFTMMVVI